MIKSFTVLSAVEPNLETLLPVGSKIDINSNIVLVVGPNGTGKTAVSRMLYSSLKNQQFLEMAGQMRVSRSLPIRAEEIHDNSSHEDNYEKYGITERQARFYFFLDPLTIHSLRIYKSIFPELDFSEDDLRMIFEKPKANEYKSSAMTQDEFRNLVFDAKDWVIPEENKPHQIDEKKTLRIFQEKAKQTYPNADEYVLKCILDKFKDGSVISYHQCIHNRYGRYESDTDGQDRLVGAIIRAEKYLDLEDQINELTDPKTEDPRIVWTYFMPETEGTRVFGYSASPDISIRERQTIVFNPYNNLNSIYKDSRYVDFLTFDVSPESIGKPSSGTEVIEKFNNYLRVIDEFYSDRKLPVETYLKDVQPKGSIDRHIKASLRDFNQYCSIPDNASLAVFTDEPTVYLDAVNKKFLLSRLFGLSDKHPGTQVIITTNDTDLIRAAPKDTIYVVCGDGPIHSTRNYNI